VTIVVVAHLFCATTHQRLAPAIALTAGHTDMNSSHHTTSDVFTTSFLMGFADGDASEPITATLRYSVYEPFAVTAGFSLPDSPAVYWVMARDLLRDGVTMPSGLGDIKIYPTPDGLLIELHSPSGMATLLAPIEPVAQFVNTIYAAVPEESEGEYFSIEAELDMFPDLRSQPEPGVEA
jgi:hypothetical protein